MAGANYGWPDVTLGLGYGGPWRANPVQGRHDGYTEPLFAFVPSIGISNLVLAPADFALWDGDLLVASLRDKALYRLRLAERRVLYSERIELGERLRDLVPLASGGLAALTDSARVLIIRAHRKAGAQPNRLEVRGSSAVKAHAKAVLSQRGFNRPGLGAAVFASRCSGCHTLDGTSDVGPPLNGLLGRAPGAVADFAYSPALADAGGSWNELRLLDFLIAPAGAFAATTMPVVPLAPEEYWPVIEFLRDEAR